MDDISDFGRRRRPAQRIDFSALDMGLVRRIMRWGLGLLALILVFAGLEWAQGFYTELLWFRGVGQQAVLVKIVATQVVLFLAAVAVFLAIGLPSLYGAARAADRPPLANAALQSLDYHFVRKFLVRVAATVVGLAALLLALHPASQWETVLLFLNRVPFGVSDPIYGHDLSFFIFTLPAVHLVQGWLIGVVVSVGLIVLAFHYVTGQLRGEPRLFGDAVRGQVAVLLAVLFLLIAVGHWLSRYELLYSQAGTVFGVGYTDAHVTRPGLTFMTLVAVAAAGFILFGALRRRGYRWILLPAAAWFVLLILADSAAPWLVQRLRVEPAELALERDYLASNIEFTRDAFGLADLESRDHPARGAIDARTVADNQGTLRNVRLWDEGPLLESYNQIQFFRLYYDFRAVNTDRYTVDGQLRQVMLATRELSPEKLPAEAQRWVNRRLQFTHGYGVAMSPVTEVAAGGRPSFFISDVPPVGVIPLEQPEIYYGLQSLDHVIVHSGMQEFNYPGQDGPSYTQYGGHGGVELSSFTRRLLYAWQFRDLNILISGEISPDSRIQYRRKVAERVRAIAPFLMEDRQPYVVVADGRLFWIQDLYTVTNRYPYATRWNGRLNYIRNSVKAVVDAYDGSVDFYVFDPDDPLVRAYQGAFPGLFKSRDEMPDYLRDHVRVPLDMFTIQTQMMLQYHMRDPVVFYNKEDQWDVPIETSFGRSSALQPYYIVARLPGEQDEEFLLIQPFTPDKRHNLVGWMAARNDGEHYGQLLLFRFPTGRQLDGPNQIEARIDNDAVISEQFTLWGQVGSEVSRGILLVIPLGDAILYAEPIFLKPETLEFPELRRIILADANRVVMHQTLDESVAALAGELPAVAPVAEAEGQAAPNAAPADSELLEAVRQGLEQTIQRLQELLDQLKKGGG